MVGRVVGDTALKRKKTSSSGQMVVVRTGIPWLKAGEVAVAWGRERRPLQNCVIKQVKARALAMLVRVLGL